MRINPIKTLYNTYINPIIWIKTSVSGFDYPPSAHAAKSSLTATKITYKNPVNPDLSTKPDPETSVEICRKSPQKTA